MPVLETNQYNRYEPEKLLDMLKRNQIAISDLEPKNRNHVEAVTRLFKVMPSRYKEISSETDYKFLLEILKKDYKAFAYLDKKQYRSDIAQIFLLGILKETRKKSDYAPEVYLSYDEKIAISYEYVTRKGDEIYYFDSELKVPASLISKFKATIRVEDPVEFVKMLDVCVRDFCAPLVFNNLYYIFNASFRKVLFEMLNQEGVGYYTVTNSLPELEEATSEEINGRFSEGCAVVTSLVIKKVEVDREVRDKMENEFFELRKKRINIDEELKYQKDSMELFGKKLELLNKYAAPKEMLTEAEKDKAFDRYAKKGRIVAGDKLSGSKLIDRADEALNGGIELDEDKAAVEKKGKPATFFIRLFGGIIYAIVMLILTTTLMARGLWMDGLIGYGVATLCFALILIFTAVADKNRPQKSPDDEMVYDDTAADQPKGEE